MEAVKTQDVGVNDLPWKIEYDPSRCTMCGSCVASCSFKSIKVSVERRAMTISEGTQPEPKHLHAARPVIKQVASLTDYCRGCGICEKVCPNNAIRPVLCAHRLRNTDRRTHRKANDHDSNHMQYLAAHRYGRNAGRPFKLPDDEKICHAVKRLQKIRKKIRQRK